MTLLSTHRIATATCAFLACSGLASAQCPTEKDLRTGIEFTVDGENSEIYKAENPNIVSVLYSAPDGYQSRILLGKGIYLLEFAELVDGTPDASSRTTYSHALQPEDMPMPKPMGRWVSEAAILEGGSPGKEIHNHSFGPLTELTIGTCSYDMIPIKVRYDDEDQTIDELEYLPSLGIALLAGVSYDEGDERTVEVYSYTAVTKARGDGGSSGGKKGKKGG